MNIHNNETRQYLRPELVERVVGVLVLIPELAQSPEQPLPFDELLCSLFSAIKVALELFHVLAQPHGELLAGERVGILAQKWEAHGPQRKFRLCFRHQG